jgi:hypothetical protein
MLNLKVLTQKDKAWQYLRKKKLCLIKTPKVVKAKRGPLVNIGKGEGDTR